LILRGKLRPLSRYVDDVPAELERIVAKGLTKTAMSDIRRRKTFDRSKKPET
jgi:hypothetical protein